MHMHSRLSKAIARTLVGVMWVQPLLTAAADVRLDSSAGGNTQLTQAGNGVPVVNIAKPTAKGLSHNKFTDYNVQQQGLILNNSTEKYTPTQLGGIIMGNTQLQGQSARLIINEVTGGQASQLKGYTEVAGQQAHVVVANPHGITCDGCGFINTPHATLTTGKPMIKHGELKSYEVDGGQIEITGAGLNASNVSQFDLITRSAKINADLYADQLNIIAGRNSVEASTLTATAYLDHPEHKPQLAIDSSALGGMYAGAIRLVGTEAGVGVKLAGDMAASAGDIQIDASGKLTLARASAQHNVALNAPEIELAGQVYAADQVRLQAQALTNTSNVLAANRIDLAVREIDNQGLMTAGQELVVASQSVKNTKGELISEKAVRLNLSGGDLDNSQGGFIYAPTVGLEQVGLINNSEGEILSSVDFRLDAQQLNNQGGQISSGKSLTAQVENVNNSQQGLISAGQDLNISAHTFDNSHKGTLIAKRDLSALVDERINNSQAGVVLADGHLQLRMQRLDNSNEGVIVSDQQLKIVARHVDNQQGGLISGESGLDITANHLNNQHVGTLSSGAGELNIKVAGQVDNSYQGAFISKNALSVEAGELRNQQGIVFSTADVGLQLSGDIDNQQGQIAGRHVMLTAESLFNNAGEVVAEKTLGVALLEQLLNEHDASIVSGEALLLTANSIRNQNSIIASDGLLTIIAQQLHNEQQARIAARGPLLLEAQQLYNHNQGYIYSQAVGHIKSQQLTNQGSMTTAGDLFVDAQHVLNHGTLGSGQQLHLYAPFVENENALMFSGSDMNVQVGQLNNRYADLYSLGGIHVSGYAPNSSAQRVENISGTIQAAHDFSLQSAVVDNRRDVLEVDDQGKYYASITELRCGAPYIINGDCKLGSNGKRNSVWQVTQREKTEVLNSSAASNLLAGGHLSFVGDELLNSSSLISSGADLNLSFQHVNNLGVQPVDIEVQNIYIAGRRPKYKYPRNEARAFNLTHNPAVRKGSVEADISRFIANNIEREYLPGRQYIEKSLAGEEYSAVIQAGANVVIDAQQTLKNSVIRSGYTDSSSGVSDTVLSSETTQVPVHLQLPPDLQHKYIDPIDLPGFSLPEVGQGLFRLSDQAAINENIHHAHAAVDGSSARSDRLVQQGLYEKNQGQSLLARFRDEYSQNNTHRYLIETNPALTHMQQFVSSDYLLDSLGVSSDQMQKRLGDGLYEQKLMREAVVARTGQRFIAGLSSDEAMYTYLMDNAVASQAALDLSVGVSLSAEQVAALTQDIVWLEERDILGEKVLVPVLYLAQSDKRLAASGALIQGENVSLTSSGSVINDGALHATNNLSMQAHNISNRGLIQANGGLSLLAEEHIYNRQGGILTGHDVELTARTGDILNERTVTRHTSDVGNNRWETSFVNSAARIEASRDLTLNASRDVQNLGGVLDSRADIQINAGRDVMLASVEERQSISRGNHYLNAQSQQLGSTTQADGHLNIQAGRDLTAVASGIESGADMELVAGRDLSLVAATDEKHSYSKSKNTTSQRDQITQQASHVYAGGDIELRAEQDLNITASEVKAVRDIGLISGQDARILSALDEESLFYSKKSKKSFGRSKSKQQESYDSTNVASVIDAGNNLTINTRITDAGGLSLEGGRNVTVIGSQLNAGLDLLVGAINDITILSGVEEHGSYSKKTKSGFLGLNKSGKSQLKTTATQMNSELSAANDVVLVAGNDLGVRASTVDAGNDVELRAGLLESTGDINLLSANNEAYNLSERYRKKTGLSASGGMVAVSSAKKAGQAAQSSTSVGSQVIAEGDASLQAERDINIVGSGVSAGGNLLLDAGRDVQVIAADNENATSTWQRERRTGIAISSDRNGVTAFAGNDTKIDKRWDTQSAAAASLLETGENLDIKAGRDIRQTGSDLAAGRDVNLIAERNIILDAASEQRRQQQKETHQRTGLTVSVNHNFGNTMDAIKGAGRGDNGLSQVSGVLKALDSVTQFVSGPTTSEHLGTTRQQTTTVEDIQSYRESTLDAGRDINLLAGQDVEARGTRINSQRDINIAGQNITLDVARGYYAQNAEHTMSQSGINGSSTANSARVGIGSSHSKQTDKGRQDTSLPTQLQAGRDVNLESVQDLTLIGTQVQAQRDIQLSAGQDLSIRAAQNDSTYETRRKSGGSEVGLALGEQVLLSVYVSADAGKGKLDRESAQQQEAYLYAGNHLNFSSGRDTIVAGAQLEGEKVTGRVGRDLLVTSVADTGKVSGKESDASLTASVGLSGGASFSGSVGVGKTTGSTDWIENQTRITARDALDIRTENHTQLDSAVIASNTDNLKLDTNTLGFSDFKGHDKERSWYVNAGGTYSLAADSGNSESDSKGSNAAAKTGAVDRNQDNKDGSNQWNISGYHSEKDRQQIVRATVGEGEIIVRSDAGTGENSTQGLNRDTSKAYEITKDKQETTELYVSSSSFEPFKESKLTVEQWKQGIQDYGLNSAKAFLQLGLLKDRAATEAENNNLVAALTWAPSLLVKAMDSLNTPTGGVFPGVENHGGLATQIPALAVGDLMVSRAKGKLKLDEKTGQLVVEKGKPVLDGVPTFDSFDGFTEDEKAHIATNGIMNSQLEAMTNALMQGGMEDGQSFVLAYNPTHGLIGDLLESAVDSLFKGSVKSGTARNLDSLYQQASQSPIENLHLYGHSQGGLLTWVAVKGQDFSNIELVTVQLSGAPVDAVNFHDDVEATKAKETYSVYQTNRPEEKTILGLPKTDAVADLPGLGGNAQYSDDQIGLTLGALFSLASLFDTEKSAHSNYGCVTCERTGWTETSRNVREIVINPTLIDIHGNHRKLNE